MDIDRKVRLPTDVACHFYYFGAPPRIAADLGMSLHTLDKIAVCICGRNCRLDVHAGRGIERGIEVALEAAGQIS